MQLPSPHHQTDGSRGVGGNVATRSLRLEAGRLVLDPAGHDRAFFEVLRRVPGRSFSDRTRCWTFPLAARAALIKLAPIWGVTVDEALLQPARRHTTRERGSTLRLDVVDLLGESRAMDAELEVPGLQGELRPFQRAGVRYAVKSRRCVIGDEMGLGKTPQCLASLQVTGSWPAVIIVPSAVKVNWLAETNRWLPHLRVGALYGVPSNELAAKVAGWIRECRVVGPDFPVQAGRRIKIDVAARPDPMYVYRLITQLDVIVVNYDIIGPTIRNGEDIKRKRHPEHGWTPILKALPLRAVAADESQYIANPGTLRARACKEIARSLEADDIVLALSGSPVLNRRSEMAAQLDFIGRLDEFGGYKAVGGMSDLAARLRSRCMVRRKKAQVMPDMPPREHVRVYVPREELDPAVMRQYEKAERDLLAYLADEARQIALELGEDPESAAVQARMRARGVQYLLRINVLRQLVMRAKLPFGQRWIQTFLKDNPDEKLLVFSDHLEPIDLYAARFAAPIIKGSVKPEDRQRIVDRFQTDPTLRTVMLQMQAGGVGLTMTAASNVMFHEQGWAPLMHDQCIDRCYARLNDPHGAVGWYLLAEGTIDEWISDLLVAKRIECDDALDGDMKTMEGQEASVMSGLIRNLTHRALAG